MKVYLLQSLVDNCAYVTERVCFTKEIAERELIKFKKKQPSNWRVSLKIEEEKVIEK